MSALRQRWQGLNAREQWLAVGVALLLAAMAWLTLGHDPLAARLQSLQAERQAAQSRLLEARSAEAELQARAAADPDRALRQALLAARALRDSQLVGLEQETAALIDPQRMQQVLQELLHSRPGLHLLGLESFSAPLELPAAQASGAPAGEPQPEAPALTLYRHGMRLTLEGSYFELRDYLRGIEQQSRQPGGRRLFWERLDYQVGEAGPGRARIVIELYTLSRHAGWVGV